MRTRPGYYYTQSAVIPYRLRNDALEILTITSRRRKRWVIPKGIKEPELTAAASAAKEALEEAGVEGTVWAGSIGHYSYRKWGGICTVEGFPMQVTRIHDHWDEEFRERQWTSLAEAIARMDETALRELLQQLPQHLAAGHAGHASGHP